MTQTERRQYLIRALLAESSEYAGIQIPGDEAGQRRLLRSLMNVRPAAPASGGFLRVQDEYLREAIAERGITDIASLRPVPGRGGGELYLWRGDITTLRCGAIVNAANSGMTGCYQPCHSCIDNCIHTFAGIQLRSYCGGLMARQGHEEPAGQAKLTPAYNLPCRYVLHTVGPVITGRLTQADCGLLASCYTSCLALADEHGIDSVAFCCISTGVFRFPADRAAEIAVAAVERYKREAGSRIKAVFNVFSERDEELYRRALGIR